MRNAIESEAVLAEILATADAEVHGMRNYETPCYCTFNIVGPSGVRALPLAAGINEGDHYFRYFYSSCLLVVVVTTVVQNLRRGCCRVSNFCMGS